MKICRKSTCNCRHHQLIECISEEKNEQAEEILQQLVNGPELRNAAGSTLLHYSVRFGNEAITEYLLQHGYSVDAQENDGTTALMLSVVNRHVPISEILLSHNADIHLKNEAKLSSLELAVHCVFDMFNLDTIKESKAILEMFVAIVEREFERDQRLPYSYEVRLALVTMGSEGVVAFLLKRGFCRFRAKERSDALHWAMRLAKPRNVALLLDWQGAKVIDALRCFANNYLGTFTWADAGKKVLRVWMRFISKSLAASDELRDDSQIAIEQLLVRGSREDARAVLQSVDTGELAFRSGCSFVHLLMENPNDDVTQALEEPGLRWEVDARRADGKTPLLIAAHHHRLAKLRFLLGHGADANATSGQGESALGLALARAEADADFAPTLCATWQLLLQHGADAQQSFGGAGTVVDVCRPYEDLEKVVVAHLALLGTREPPTLKPEVRAAIAADSMSRRYFLLCTVQLHQMKNIKAHVDVTLWKLLAVTEAKLLDYARIVELKQALNILMLSYTHLESYFIDSIYERLEKAINRVALEKQAVKSIENLTGLCRETYHFLFRRVIDFLSLSDLHNLVKI